MADPVDAAAARLYGIALEDFVSERDAAARSLRKQDREAAARIARLPKPAAQAWAANRVASERPELRDRLLAAGDALRAAQEAALAGQGRDDLRTATARLRGAVDAFVEAARALRPAGRPLSAAARERLRGTLHASAADPDVRAALAAGRLVGDAQAGGAWPLGEAAATGGEAATGGAAANREADPRADSRRAERPAGARHRRKPGGGRRARDEAQRDAAQRDEAEREAAERDEAERAAAQRDEAEREAGERAAAERRRKLESQLAAARATERAGRRDVSRAEREAERSAERLKRAQAAARDAGERAAAAASALDAASAALAQAREETAGLAAQLD